MKFNSASDALISVAYFQKREIVTSPRYHWDCWKRGDQPFVILQWTQSGEGVYENEDGPQRVPANHAFISVVPERSTYYYPAESREPWVFGWMNFYGPLPCALFQAFQMQVGPVVFLPPRGVVASAFRRLKAAASNLNPPDRWQTSTLAYAFLMEWWRESAEPGKGSEQGFERALRFCRDHFREQHGVKQIAHEAGMSREHFSRIFSQSMKETPAAYLRRLRLREAEVFLRETRLPLGEIAMRSGFYSARHLLRVFQRAHRQSPTAFRRRQDYER